MNVRFFATNANGTKKAWQYGLDLANWTVLRRIYSTRTIHETMVDFWSNHPGTSKEVEQKIIDAFQAAKTSFCLPV